MALSKDYAFESERLRFRGIEGRDAADIVRWRTDPDNYRNFLDPRPITLEEHLAWFARYLKDPTRFDFMIEDTEGTPIGTCGLSDIDGGSCEISYMIGAAEARGKGYATEAVRALTEVAFRELGVDHVDARILPHNVASLRVAAGGGSPSMRESSAGAGTVLLLTNNENTGGFRSWLEANEGDVVVMQDQLDEDVASSMKPAFAVSFNYRHIIRAGAIEALGCPVVNVHCSVLPWNRGASPNFFSYYENTPKGVTVHELTSGLDKGDILLQSVMALGDDETFASSYEKLIDRATEMLCGSWWALRGGLLSGVPQPGSGSYHTVADFEAVREKYPFEWDDRISDWKGRYGLE